MPFGWEQITTEKPGIKRLNAAIYGLVQASRTFYTKMRTYLKQVLEFRECECDACILVKDGIVIGMYVDDLLIIG